MQVNDGTQQKPIGLILYMHMFSFWNSCELHFERPMIYTNLYVFPYIHHVCWNAGQVEDIEALVTDVQDHVFGEMRLPEHVVTELQKRGLC